MTPGGLREVAVFDTTDGLYDCVWSEDNENILVSASGDGSIKVWDLNAPPAANPLRSFEEHTREVPDPLTAELQLENCALLRLVGNMMTHWQHQGVEFMPC